MKLQRFLNPTSAILTVAFTCLGAGYGLAQQASTTIWTGGNGNWSAPTWSAGVPSSGSLAGILNGTTVTVASPAATDLAQILIDGSSALVVQSSIGVTGSDLIDNDPAPDTPATGFFVNAGTVTVGTGGLLNVSAGGNFRIGNGGNGTLTLTEGSITTDRPFVLGTGAAATSVFNQTGGSMTHTANEFRVGAFDAMGTYNLSGGSATTNIMKVGFAGQGMGTVTVSGAATQLTLNGETSVGWDALSSGLLSIEDGSVTANGRLRIGVVGAAPASGVRTARLNLSGGSLTVNAGIDIGDAMPAANVNQVNLSGGSLTTTGAVTVGFSGTSSGILNVSGSANAELFRLFISSGAETTGTVNLSSGLVKVASELTVGPNAAPTSTARLNILDAGTLETNNFRIRNGTVTQSGESSSVSVIAGGGGFLLGIDTAGAASYLMSAGTLFSDTRLRMGVNTTNSILFNQTGGEVSINGRLDLVENAGTSNVYQISAGSLTTTGNAYIGAFSTGTGTFNVSGTADVDFAGELAIGRNSTTGITNMTGGSVKATIGTVGEGATGQGTLNVGGTALLELTGLRVKNGAVTQNGASSLVDVVGDIIVGNSNVANATYNMQAGTLSGVGRLRFGIGAGIRTNLFQQTGGNVVLKNRLDIGEIAGPTNIYRISGGSLKLDGGDRRILVGFFNDSSGTLEVSGSGMVEASSVVLGEFAAAVGTVNLNGGVLITDQIKSGLAPASSGTLNINGGTIRSRVATAVNIDGNRPANLLAGGVTFDVPESGWTTTTTGIMTGVGGLTKSGPGTLVVNGVQAYSGATRVTAGTLSLVEPYLSELGDVFLFTGATLNLQFAGANRIRTLFIDGVPQPVDTYDSGNTSLISGSGSLTSTVAGALMPPKIISISRTGNTATIMIDGAPGTEYIAKSSLNLIGFTPIATNPTPVITDGSGKATFTVDATESKKFYTVEAAP